jgi:hypothetical protein
MMMPEERRNPLIVSVIRLVAGLRDLGAVFDQEHFFSIFGSPRGSQSVPADTQPQ